MDPLHIEQVLPWLYSLHGDKFEVFPETGFVEFDVVWDAEALQRVKRMSQIAIQQEADFKVKYLHDRYHFEREGPRCYFHGTCLNILDDREGTIVWRKRSEWFRKFVTDFIFATDIIPGHKVYHCMIPRLWIRPLSTPLLKLWLEDAGLPMAPRHLHEALRTIERYPPDKLVFLQHRLTRRLLLRYYYRLGYWPDPERRHFHFSRPAKLPVPKELEFNQELDYDASLSVSQRASFGNSARPLQGAEDDLDAS